MTWYVHRRGDGSIASAHSEIRPGYAEEAVDESNPELAAILNPSPEWWQRRRDLYCERIANHKGVPEASHQDVLGFVVDATIKAMGGDAAELNDIAAIVQGVKTDVPKP